MAHHNLRSRDRLDYAAMADGDTEPSEVSDYESDCGEESTLLAPDATGAHGKSSMKGWCGQTAPGAGWPQTGGSGLYLQNSIFSAIPLIINEQYEPRKAVLYYFVLIYLCAHRTWGIW